MDPLSNVHLALRATVILTLCGLVGLPRMARPQTANTLGHQSWSTENGLPQNSVHQTFQSRDGYIWIATEAGIARFDGIEFKLFDHENTPAFISDDTCCFAQSSANSLWIGTSDGLFEYSTGAFRRYSTSEGLPSGQILSIAATDDGTLLVRTPTGISIFDGKHFAALRLPDASLPSAITAADNGGIWISSTSGIFQYHHREMVHLPLPLPFPYADIQAIGALPNHGLWLRTQGTLALAQNGRISTLQIGKEIPASRLQSVLADSRGQLWIGTNKGLFSFEQVTNYLQAEPALLANSILSLTQDMEGNLWVGTETSGLSILRQQNFHSVAGLSDHVTSIIQASDGAMWVGTNGDGLDRWQDGKMQHFTTYNGLLSDIVLSLAPGASGTVWIGTPDGLNYIDHTRVKSFTSADGLPDDLVRSLLSSEDGSLWIGTRRGLAHWQDNRFSTLAQADGLKSDLIGTLLQPHSRRSPDDLWIGTLNGLSRLRDGKLTTFTTNDGLSSNTITSLFEAPDGTLWIGTMGGGISVLSSSGFHSLCRKDLPQTVDSILGDDDGNLWLSSNHGITRVSVSALLACGPSPACDPHALSYGRSDGMPSEETTSIGHPATWKTKEGLLWFATRKGVAVTDPNHLSVNLVAPPVVIERFTVDDMDQPLPSTEQDISPGHKSFTFQYAAFSFVSPTKVRYRYILEGFDKQWTEAGARRIAYYTNLPPRHYRFRVQAANNDGLWNETGAQILFYVRPPFYRRLWFLPLILFLIAAITFLLYRLRVQRLQAQFQAVLAERNRVAREIHDTLAQSFVGVSVQLELTAQLLAQAQISAAGQQIDRTRTYVREGLAEARRSIWDLRAVTAQHTLPTRLTHLAEQRTTKELAIDLKIGGTYRPLAPIFEEEVLRIAQESLTNVDRHAKATRASIDLRYYSNRLSLIISDNGTGFHPPGNHLREKGHFGLQGMHERAAQIHAQLTIESSPENGTSVKLDAPISQEKGTENHA